MKKIGKKIVALVMAMVMTLAMCTSVFASTNNTVNVDIQWEGTSMFGDQNLNLNYIQSLVPSGQNHIYNVPAGVNNQNNGLTAADALLAMENYINGAITSDVVDYSWDYIDSETGQIKPDAGLYFTLYEGISADAGNYYFVRTEPMTVTNENGEPETKTAYYYYWGGNTWNLYIDGILSNAYASSCLLNNSNSVVFNYKYTTTEEFYVFSPIPGAL